MITGLAHALVWTPILYVATAMYCGNAAPEVILHVIFK